MCGKEVAYIIAGRQGEKLAGPFHKLLALFTKVLLAPPFFQDHDGGTFDNLNFWATTPLTSLRRMPAPSDTGSPVQICLALTDKQLCTNSLTCRLCRLHRHTASSRAPASRRGSSLSVMLRSRRCVDYSSFLTHNSIGFVQAPWTYCCGGDLKLVYTVWIRLPVRPLERRATAAAFLLQIERWPLPRGASSMHLPVSQLLSQMGVAFRLRSTVTTTRAMLTGATTCLKGTPANHGLWQLLPCQEVGTVSVQWIFSWTSNNTWNDIIARAAPLVRSMPSPGS